MSQIVDAERALKDGDMVRSLVDMEAFIRQAKSSADSVAYLMEHVPVTVDAEYFKPVAPYVEAGFRVSILTECEDDVFAHAIYQASSFKRAVSKKFDDATGGTK